MGQSTAHAEARLPPRRTSTSAVKYTCKDKLDKPHRPGSGHLPVAVLGKSRRVEKYAKYTVNHRARPNLSKEAVNTAGGAVAVQALSSASKSPGVTRSLRTDG